MKKFCIITLLAAFVLAGCVTPFGSLKKMSPEEYKYLEYDPTEAGAPPSPPAKRLTDAEVAAGTSTDYGVITPKILADNYSGASVEVEDDVYGAGWDGDTNHAPSQNAVYDKIETLSGTGDLLADGTVPLTANWDVGAYTITGTRFISDIAIGTAPLAVTSTTVVTNLNADLLDGESAAAFEDADAAIVKSDEAETLSANWVNTANPWAFNEIASIDEDTMATDSNTLVPSQQSVKAYVDGLASNYEPADAAIVKSDEAETLSANWVNTANPWADNEVADTLTVDSSSSVSGLALDIAGITVETEIAANDEVIIYDTSAGANRSMTRGNFVTGIGAGQAVVFDIGDDGGNDSTDVGEIATTGDTNTIFTESSADKILIAVGNNWPTSDVAVLAQTVTIADNESTNETNAVVFLPGGDLDGGNLALESDGTFNYNPSTGTVTATAFAGDLTGAVTGNADSATAVTVSDDEATDDAQEVVFTTNNTNLESDGDFTYNPVSGTLAATEFSGGGAGLTAVDAATGDSATDFFDAGEIADARIPNDITIDTASVATGVTVSANNSTDETIYPLFVDGATGTQGAETDTGLTYNPSTGLMSSVGFTASGAVTSSTISAGAGGMTVDADGDLVAKSITFPASTNPGWAAEDSDADAIGTFTFSIDALTAGQDSQIIYKVDDSSGEDTTYMTIDGSAEVVNMAKPVTMDSTLGVTGTLTVGTSSTISDAAGTTMTLDDGDGAPITLDEIRTMVAGAENNNLEADGAVGITTTEIFIGNGAGTGVYAALSGDATMSNTGAVTIANNAVENAMMADNAIDTAELAADAVEGTKIADDQVDSEHYVAGSIDNEHLAANSVDSDNYVDGSIDEAHMSANSIDSDSYVDGSIDIAHMSTDSVDYDNTTGSVKALTPVVDAAADFAANFTGANLYGGTFICDTAGTAALPAVAAGMNFTVIIKGAVASVFNPDATGTEDTIHLVTPSLGYSIETQGENIDSSADGSMCVFQYYAADTWLAICSDDFTAE